MRIVAHRKAANDVDIFLKKRKLNCIGSIFKLL